MKIAQRNDAEEIEAANQYQHDAQASESYRKQTSVATVAIGKPTHSLARRAGVAAPCFADNDERRSGIHVQIPAITNGQSRPWACSLRIRNALVRS